jgi:hypothetical protein
MRTPAIQQACAVAIAAAGSIERINLAFARGETKGGRVRSLPQFLGCTQPTAEAEQRERIGHLELLLASSAGIDPGVRTRLVFP